jgi:hypothetical protein
MKWLNFSDSSEVYPLSFGATQGISSNGTLSFNTFGIKLANVNPGSILASNAGAMTYFNGTMYFANGTKWESVKIDDEKLRTDSSGNFNWTLVYSRTYAAGGGNHATSDWVQLDATRKVYGFRITGTIDDGGACMAGVPGYFNGGSGIFMSNWTYIPVDSIWFGDANAWNNNWGNIPDAQFVFDSVSSGLSRSASAGHMTISNKQLGLTFIPPGQYLNTALWYNDGGGNAYATCNVYALYGSSPAPMPAIPPQANPPSGGGGGGGRSCGTSCPVIRLN